MVKFIVYESSHYKRFIAREVVGQTDQFWKVRSTFLQGSDTRLKKESIGPCAFVDSAEAAEKLAKQYTDKMVKAYNHYKGRKTEVLNQLVSQSTYQGESTNEQG